MRQRCSKCGAFVTSRQSGSSNRWHNGSDSSGHCPWNKIHLLNPCKIDNISFEKKRIFSGIYVYNVITKQLHHLHLFQELQVLWIEASGERGCMKKIYIEICNSLSLYNRFRWKIGKRNKQKQWHGCYTWEEKTSLQCFHWELPSAMELSSDGHRCLAWHPWTKGKIF